MNNQFTGQTTSGISGALSTMVWYTLTIDWGAWATTTGLKVIEVAIVGIVGGAMGLIGKHLVEKYIIKTKKI